ncbi:hypothetical protein J1N35_030169 [Gossypium stocksii]|uniref:Transmembrane protein n=1 Tax=Gossypium stocksii TaxID=47602 RepID=A0A9D3ZTW7_9ROSI|nr:hypothetical protein J1N35_030169 [Gossypium stocksii]
MPRNLEEMQFVGFFGIFKQSYKIISSCTELFAKITLALILPLSFIFLVHFEVSSPFSRNNILNKLALNHSPPATAKFEKLSHLISHETVYLWLFNAACSTLTFILSLLSVAAVVYTTACIYTAQELTFNQVIISVVPKVWNRLLVTFLCILGAMFVYFLVLFLVLVACGAVSLVLISCGIPVGQIQIMGVAVFVILIILFSVGLFYLITICLLASIVTVLEEVYGFAAMVKSKNLIKGKIWLAISITFILELAGGLNVIAFRRLVVGGARMGMANRFVYAIICLLLLSTMSLFRLVIETVIYFVCKSYHHENIDKTVLSDHLEVYLQGEYAPLKANDVQLFHVD